MLHQGVTDPLGGVNTLWPLFGISNQMLAAVALILAAVVLFKMKRQRYAWVAIAPAAWLCICTLTAGLQKILSPDSAVGFLAHAAIYGHAFRAGEVLAPAKNLSDMGRILLNDRVDAALCALFIGVVVSMIGFGFGSCRRAARTDHWTARESRPVAAAGEA
jgi:carbon starvation protein